LQTVLVIDDDPAFMAAAESMLADAGYRVVQATDGSSAVRLLDLMRDDIDLAIVDLALPDINGFELIGALTRRPNSIKILATTAVYNDMQLETAAVLGAHAAIRKPAVARNLQRQEWLGTIERLIGKPRTEASLEPH
jgi:two-component system NarL family response regulator